MNWTDDTTIPDAEYGYCPQCLDVELEYICGWINRDESVDHLLKCPACGANVNWHETNTPLAAIIPPYNE